MDETPANGGSWPPAGEGRGWPRPSRSSGPARSSGSARGDDPWGPSTAVYSASYGDASPGAVAPPRSRGGGGRPGARNRPEDRAPAAPAAPPRQRRADASPDPRADWARDAVRARNPSWTNDAARNERSGNGSRTTSRDDARGDGWSTAGPVSARQQRATRAADRRAQERMEQSVRALRTRPAGRPERGTRWWPALLVLIGIAALGGIIDVLSSLQGGFNVAIVIASIVAIVMVRRSHMFPIVIAPPIVYTAGAVFQLYIRSSGLSDKKVILDAAANYLVYGFPAIAVATAAVLIIAGVRLIARR